MKKRMTKLLSVCMAAGMVISMAPSAVMAADQAPAAAAETGSENGTGANQQGNAGSGQASQPGMPDMPGGPGGGPGGEAGNAQNSSANNTGVLTIASGKVTNDASKSGIEDSQISTASDGTVTVDGQNKKLTNDDYSYTLLSASDSNVVLKNMDIILGVGSKLTDTSAAAGEATYVDSGKLDIEDSSITVNGAGRYTIAAEKTAQMTVNNSSIIAGGDEGANGNTSEVSAPRSNQALLVSGTSRSNFSVGESKTFYYNSLCVAEGWAAMSTDSATGDGLDFVAYNSQAIARHGGYGIYADTNCRDYLYGVDFDAAELGGIISNNGEITIGSTDDAKTATIKDGTPVLANNKGSEISSDKQSVITAGRNDFQIHSPDMMGEGNDGDGTDTTAMFPTNNQAKLNISNSKLITDDSINKDGKTVKGQTNGENYTVKATYDYSTYGKATGAYVDFVKGAAILVKSTCADINLNHVSIDSYSDVAVMSVLNSDGMSRYLKPANTYKGDVSVNISNSDINGDYVHDDYQRDMNITVDNSTISGDVTFDTADEWNARWASYKDDENCKWILDAGTYVTDTHDTALTLKNNSTWNVKNSSELTSLTVEKGSKINGYVTVNGKSVTPAAGKTYTGTIVVTKAAPKASLGKVKSVKLAAKKKAIKVSYKKVKGATGYQIYRAESKNGKYKVVKTTKALSYSNKGLKSGKKYYYKVRAYSKAGGTTVYGAYSAAKSAKAK